MIRSERNHKIVILVTPPFTDEDDRDWESVLIVVLMRFPNAFLLTLSLSILLDRIKVK